LAVWPVAAVATGAPRTRSAAATTTAVVRFTSRRLGQGGQRFNRHSLG
jgi:hypothetical protein